MWATAQEVSAQAERFRFHPETFRPLPSQRLEPSLAGFVHSYVLMHEQSGLGRALASLLANKLASRTLLAAQLQGLFLQAYEEDAVRSLLPVIRL